MKLTKVTRTYSRSMSFRKPDGSEMWIRHEMTAEAEPEEMEVALVSKGLEEIVRKEVGASMKAEKEKILASFHPDEPFAGTTQGSVATMPRL